MGLDISYHGGIPGGQGASVKKEYVDAYNRHKSSIRRRVNPGEDGLAKHHKPAPTWMSSGMSEAGRSTSEVSDPDRDQLAAMQADMEATP